MNTKKQLPGNDILNNMDASLKSAFYMHFRYIYNHIDENLMIQEGMKMITEKELYMRSKQLRDYALLYYGNLDRINCTCCGFDFLKFYGKEIGDCFIEMHHIKPIFRYQEENLVQTIKKAVLNITPLCSNCHRMVHRHGREPLKIEILINHIKENRNFLINK